MKKRYIALFALILSLVSTYGYTCEWLCHCTCGSKTSVEEITPTQTPIAPAAQTMETELVTPVAEQYPAITISVTLPGETDQTAIDMHNLPQFKKPIATRPAQVNPHTLSVPQQQQKQKQRVARKNKRLLNALRTRQYKKAQEILTTNISEEELNIRSKKRKTPLLYAIEQASTSKDLINNHYWGIVEDLIARVGVELPTTEELRTVIPADRYTECLLKYVSLTLHY